MLRVVVTGYGVVSSIGSNVAKVHESLVKGVSGVRFNPEQRDNGLASHVAGLIDPTVLESVPRRVMRFMGEGAAYAYVAMNEAIAMAGLTEDEVSDSSVVVGSGGPSTSNQVKAIDIARSEGVKRIGPFMVPRCMSSGIAANLSTAFKILGSSFCISSACATSAHCIAIASDMIKMGRTKRVFAGGGEEVHWTLTALFDAMGALSSKYNDNPTVASRAFDADRDGFVISGGSGILALEEYESAKQRGANIIAELVGYGSASDGSGNMTAPSQDGAMRSMQMALNECGRQVDYINVHGTSTPIGDISEANALYSLFKHDVPYISSTKSMTGHAQGAAGALEAVFSLIMLNNNFISPSINIFNLDSGLPPIPIVTKQSREAALSCVMSNSFGFGGTNCTLAFSKV